MRHRLIGLVNRLDRAVQFSDEILRLHWQLRAIADVRLSFVDEHFVVDLDLLVDVVIFILRRGRLRIKKKFILYNKFNISIKIF